MPFYRLLLHLYPSSYRAEYGDEMSAIFAQERRRTSGLAGTCGLWLATFVEVFSNAAAVHWEIMRRDMRYSVRSLLRSPGFAITAFLSDHDRYRGQRRHLYARGFRACQAATFS